MITEWELWACADTLRRKHGDLASEVIDDRIATLEREGMAEGARTFRLVRSRLAVLADDGLAPGVRN